MVGSVLLFFTRYRWSYVAVFLAGLGGAFASTIREQADLLYQSHRIPEARPLYATILKSHPEDTEVRLQLARCLEAMQRRGDAIDLLKETVDQQRDNASFQSEYGRLCLLAAGESSPGLKALSLSRTGAKALERAIALDPQNIAYRMGYFDFCRKAPAIAGGGMERARKTAEEVAQLDPVSGQILQASLMIEEAQQTKAIELCEKVLQIAPDNYQALYILGRAAADGGVALDRGEQALNRCLELTPGPGEPSHSGAYYRLGMIAEKRGNVSSARDLYRKAVELEPGFTEAREALQRL